MVTPGENGVPRGVVTNDYNTVQPRIGFSYDLTGNGRTVLRGGFGTFYERLQGNDIYTLANNNLPYEYTPLANSVYFSAPNCSWESTASTANPANCGNPTPFLSIRPAWSFGHNVQGSRHAPCTRLGVQHELKPSVIVVVQYVGNLGWHQNIDRPVQQFPD